MILFYVYYIYLEVSSNMGREHSLRVRKGEYDLIEKGERPLLVRVGYYQLKKIRSGDTITFDEHSVQRYHVDRVTQYASFADMLAHEEIQKITPIVSETAALQELQRIYPADKEGLGVYVFEISKQIKRKIISAIGLAKEDHKVFAKLIAKVYGLTDGNCDDYPNYFNWYWTKMVPAILNGTREILVCIIDKKIAGVVLLKNEEGEAKICALLILEEYQNMNVDGALLKKAFSFLGTTKPLITIAQHNLKRYGHLIARYEWEQTQILDKGYYNNTSREFVFNGKIS